MAEPSAAPPPTRLRGSLLLMAGAFLCALAIAELALRVIGFSYVNFDRPDPVRGNSLHPGLSGWQSEEGISYVEINSHGFRDLERALAKPSGVRRIAVVGDSFVEGRQVARERTFCAVLEGLLNERRAAGSPAVEVLNFGVSGYGTAQELLTLRNDVIAFAPDEVILVVFAGNDVTDNSRELSHELRARPYYERRGDALVLDDSFLESSTFKDREGWIASAFYALQEHSRVVQLVYRFRQLGFRGRRPPPPQPEQGLDSLVYREPSDAAWSEAWVVTERLIREMHGELAQQGIAFGIVTVSNPLQAHPDPAVRAQVLGKLGIPDLFYPDRRIAALGEATGFPVLTLAPSFQEYAERNQVFLHGFENRSLGVGHWNERGHELAAHAIADWLASGALPR